MAVTTRERSSQGHELEAKRVEITGKTNTIGRDGDARKLEMEALAFHEDVKVMKDQVSRKGDAACDLANKYDKMRIALDEARAAARTRETRYKKQDSKMALLRAEVQTLNASAQVSTKILQEKIALARELDRLRPEMDHLKTQVANYQAMVAEKNDLRRQVDSLEVALKNEKWSRKRVQSKNDDSGRTTSKWRSDRAEWKPIADANGGDHAEREYQRMSAEAQLVHERLQARIDTLETKYKTVQDELKETRSQLEKCQDGLAKSRRQTKSLTTESGPMRKRRVQQMSFSDITVQMPGNDGVTGKRPLAKKRTAERAAVGEKSTFSITPFLQRTKDVTDESIHAEPGGAGPDSTLAPNEADTDTVGEPDREPAASTAVGNDTDASELQLQTKAAPQAGTAARQRGQSKRNGLTVASSARVNRVVGKAAVGSRPKSQTANLDAVPEASTADASHKAAAAAEPQVKRRMRKLVRTANHTLLGDEEDELSVIKGVPGAKLAAATKVRTRVGGAAGGRTNALTSKAFSPLKRDRRGVNASFLV